MPTPREAVRACPPQQQHTPFVTWRGDPYMPGPLTRAVTGTREPPTPGLVLGAWVPGPDVQGLSPSPARPGGQNSQRHGPPLSWAQAREPSLFLATGWGTQDPSFPETQDGGGGGGRHLAGSRGLPTYLWELKRPPTDRASPTCSSETFVIPYCHPLSLLPLNWIRSPAATTQTSPSSPDLLQEQGWIPPIYVSS